MNEEKIQELWQILSKLDTILCGTKWICQDSYIPLLKNITDTFENTLKELKLFCFNNIGYVDEE